MANDGVDVLTLIADLLRVSGQAVALELRALDEPGASFHPSDGEWCAKEVVGHLIEAERRGFAGRIERMLAQDEPALQAWDQPSVARARQDCEKSIEAIVLEFQEVRRWGLTVLAGVGSDHLRRAGTHPHVGRLTVSDITHEWPYHDRDHLKQILENTRSMLFADMGGARGFSEID